MVRVVTDDAKQAKQALACAGFESKANPVVVVGLKNRVGAVAQLGAHLDNAGIDIVYSYASYMDDAEVVAVFKTHDASWENSTHLVGCANNCSPPPLQWRGTPS
jgi:hypothetical protein